MAQTPEGKVKDKLKKLLKEHNVYYEMPVPTGFGKSSLDFVCCIYGLYFQVETKAGKKVMSPRQKQIANKVKEAGGRAFLYNDDPKVNEELEQWLKVISQSLGNLSL